MTTRLRFVSAKNARTIQLFCDKLGARIQIYGAPVFAKGRWYLWFVPSDHGADIASRDLED